MAKDKSRPGSLGARLLNFGRDRIQRYTTGGDDTEQPESPPEQPSVTSAASPPTQPSRPRAAAPQPPETNAPDRTVRRDRVQRAPEQAAPTSRVQNQPEHNADQPRQVIGRDLLYILQRHEEMQTAEAEESAGMGDADGFDTDNRGAAFDAAPPAPPPSQGRRLQRRPPPPPVTSTPETPAPSAQRSAAPTPPPSAPAPAPRRPRPTAEHGDSPLFDAARTPAPQPAPEPVRDWDMAHFEEGEEDTAALYDGDTVKYAQPETPPSAVPPRVQRRPTSNDAESRPVRRKPEPKNSETRSKPRPTDQTINRAVEPSPTSDSAPVPHPLPLLDETNDPGYEAPFLSDSFEMNAGFDLVEPHSSAPNTPIQRDESPNSGAAQSFTEALPVATPPPARRGRGGRASIVEYPTPQAEEPDDQASYALPRFDEEIDRVTEQIDEADFSEYAAPDISMMREDVPTQVPPPIRRARRQTEAHTPTPPTSQPPVENTPYGDESEWESLPDHHTFDTEAGENTQPHIQQTIASHYGDESAVAAPHLWRYDDENIQDNHVSSTPYPFYDSSDETDAGGVDAPPPISFDAPPPTVQRSEIQPAISTHQSLENSDDGDTDDGESENSYADDFDDVGESDFDERPDLYEALLRAGMIQNTPPDSHDAPIYRAPADPTPMPSFEGVYDTDADEGYDGDDTDTIYDYDHDDDEPEPPIDEEMGHELEFGSVEASLQDLMRYATDEDEDSDTYSSDVSFDDDDSDLYYTDFDPNGDGHSHDFQADHDDTHTDTHVAAPERTPGQMIRRYAEAEADLLRLLDLPPDTPVSHGDGEGYGEDDGDEMVDESEDYIDGENGGETNGQHPSPSSPAPNISRRPSLTAETAPRPISLADALTAPVTAPPHDSYIARDVVNDDTASESGNSTSSTSGENGDGAENAAPDVDKLAREVYRKLRSRLRIEQERRSD